MKNLKSFENFSVNENTENVDIENFEVIDENFLTKFFTGHENAAAEQAAEKKFMEALADAEKAVKENPASFAPAITKNWEQTKAFLAGNASANRFRGGLRIQKGGRDKNHLYIIYDEKATGFEQLAAGAGGETNIRK